MARHIRKGDEAEVISGKHRGSRGSVIHVDVSSQRVSIEGVGVLKKHIKPGTKADLPEGGIIERPATIHWSNVLPIDPKTDKPTRVGFEVRDGKKVRIAKRSGEVL